jgi:hypothetical protein
MQRTTDITGYANAVPARGFGWAAASKKGAVALLLRSIGTDHNRLAHTGGMRPDDAARRIPSAAISNPDADELAELLAAGGSVIFHLQLGARDLPPEDSANVVGEIPGSELPQEIVLLGAHLDSWDPGTGALDDGAGVAIVVETARRLAALPRHPRRTVRVVLFANEEFGLSGARAYAEAHKDELAQIAVAAEARPRRRWGAPTQRTHCARRAARARDSRRAAAPAGSGAQPAGGRRRRRPFSARGRSGGGARAGREQLFRFSPHRERHTRQDRPPEPRQGGGRLRRLRLRRGAGAARISRRS